MPEGFDSSVWHTAQETSQVQRRGRFTESSIAHPGKMLPAIARMAIESYTKPGDLVVDPMCGIGTSLVEATRLGRDSFGVEYEQRWVAEANRNLDHAKESGALGHGAAVHGDGRNLTRLMTHPAGSAALVLTSPPYGTSLHGNVRTGNDPVATWHSKYSDDRSNLGYANDKVLLGAFAEILAECFVALRPGGRTAITTRPWRRNGNLVDLPGAVIRLGEAAGFELAERNVALLCALRSGTVVGRPSFFQIDYVRKARAKGRPLSVIAHEDLIVLRRPS